MLISYNELRERVANKMVFPVEADQINGTSIDVRLGASLLFERRSDAYQAHLTTVNLYERLPLPDMREARLRPGGEPFIIYPGAFVLAHTLEEFNLPLDVTAEFRMNSSAARMGLSHALAVWADPGWHGSTLTLELHNLTRRHAIAVYYGDRIGQMVFHKHEPVPEDRSYRVRGAYNNDPEVQQVRPKRN